MVLLLASPVLLLASSRYLSLVKEVFPDVHGSREPVIIQVKLQNARTKDREKTHTMNLFVLRNQLLGTDRLKGRGVYGNAPVAPSGQAKDRKKKARRINSHVINSQVNSVPRPRLPSSLLPSVVLRYISRTSASARVVCGRRAIRH